MPEATARILRSRCLLEDCLLTVSNDIQMSILPVYLTRFSTLFAVVGFDCLLYEVILSEFFKS